MKLDLVAISPPDFDVEVTLAYATDANLTGRPVYRNAECWLHREAAEKLGAAIALARPLGLRLRIFDALRPVEAQRNRLLLMGLMTTAGWDFYRNEWWHYQLFDARRYPLISDADLPRPML